MAQKNATPNKAQQEAIQRAGLKPLYWAVARELPSCLIICNRITKEFRIIKKIASDCENGGKYGR